MGFFTCLKKKKKLSRPAPVADGGTEAMDEEERRARASHEVVDIELLPLPGDAGSENLLQVPAPAGWRLHEAGSAPRDGLERAGTAQTPARDNNLKRSEG